MAPPFAGIDVVRARLDRLKRGLGQGRRSLDQRPLGVGRIRPCAGGQAEGRAVLDAVTRVGLSPLIAGF